MEIDENKLWFCERQGLADIYKKWDPAWDKYFEEHEILKEAGAELREYLVPHEEVQKLLREAGLEIKESMVKKND